ncbi:MAG: Ig-like domain-containing protein, partial [Bacteroidaceae bacterium]|nr:Ig-like domain-containing protein [Bacteroidaceae bacterium]
NDDVEETPPATITPPDGNVTENKDTHEYVDLGLPSGTLWATCNVGASKPEEYGDHFAWGETEPKNDYSWSTYKYCKGTYNTMTKYCTSSSYGTIDNKTELEPSDDAATANWGSGWQMPSSEQRKELHNSSYTTTTWTTMNGVKGRKITSKSNGNSIFLPASGYRYDASLSGAGSYGNYWSRSLGTSSSANAYSLYFDSSRISTYYDDRYYGRSVRPVRVNSVQTVAVSNIELSQTLLSVKVGETTQLSATVLPENATNKNLKWASSNADVATVDETGKVVAVAVGTCTITCSATDGSGVKTECQVTVLNGNSGTLDGHVYVDLGLPSGTLWATCNVGANSPEEYGDYYAWGETKPKTTYNWSTYKYCKGTATTMTKYCLDSWYGTVDNKTELEPSDDAATVNWGVDWQMPSDEQFEELINSSYTTRTWTTMNGKYGRKITSKRNGNSIFLPAAGCRYGTSLGNAGIYGGYWSRSLSIRATATTLTT